MQEYLNSLCISHRSWPTSSNWWADWYGHQSLSWNLAARSLPSRSQLEALALYRRLHWKVQHCCKMLHSSDLSRLIHSQRAWMEWPLEEWSGENLFCSLWRIATDFPARPPLEFGFCWLELEVCTCLARFCQRVLRPGGLSGAHTLSPVLGISCDSGKVAKLTAVGNSSSKKNCHFQSV